MALLNPKPYLEHPEEAHEPEPGRPRSLTTSRPSGLIRSFLRFGVWGAGFLGFRVF